MSDLDDLNGPFAGSHAVSEGWLTRSQLRSPLFVQLFRNAYVPAGMPMIWPNAMPVMTQPLAQPRR